MRTMLIVSVLTVLAAGASGCCRNPCGTGGWKPGQFLFGAGKSAAPAAVPCCDPCDPCGGQGYTGGAMMQPVAMPTMTAAPCCQ